MKVDVSTHITIERSREVVAGFAADPSNVPQWYENIKSIEWKTPRPVRIGSEIAFVAQFLGRRLSYTYVVTEFVPFERLTMRTTEGPFPMETTYLWQSIGTKSTLMSLRNMGDPKGFSILFAPFLSMAIKRATNADLARLKALLELPDTCQPD